MPKLLMVSGDRMLAGGARGAFHGTLDALRKYWERIDVICPPPVGGTATARRNPFETVELHPSPWPLPLQWRWVATVGKKLIERHAHDLVTVHEYSPFYNGLGAWLLHRATGVPYVLEIHHVPGHPRAANVREWVDRVATRLLVRFDARRAQAVRVVNEREVPRFLRDAGVPDDKIVRIPSLYIDRSVFRPMDLPKTYDLIFVGRLVANKGIALLLDAAAAAPFRWVIVGDGPLRPTLEARIRTLGLESKVTLRGWVPTANDVAELLNRSQALVAPSYNEGGPRVVVEAMACGVPVLATPVGIVPDLFSERRCGVLVDWSGADIARKAQELLEDRSAYEEIRAHGIAIADRFDREETIRRYAEALQQLIPARHA